MLKRFALAILATAILISPVMAQIHAGGFGISAAGVGGGSRAGVHMGSGHVHHGHSLGRGSLLLPYPGYYSDFGYDAPEAVPPQTVVVSAPAPVQTPPAPPLEPLLIEWHGDHFERMTLSQKASAGGQSAPDYSEKSKLGSASSSGLPARKTAAQAPRELPPAVLVFRDGRQEEVSNYTIMSGTIYSKADYWTTGSWTRKIQIADLDVPATLKLNHDHGLNFMLPASPNEVVMRP
jgi:hypothetical protein